jgi:hypothetical protein
MKKVFSLLILFFSLSAAYAQEMDLEWTKQIVMDESAQGLFDYYIGGNSKYVYAKLTNESLSPKKKNNKISFAAYDRETFKQAKVAVIVDKKSKDAKAYKELDYFRSVIFEDHVFVFWKKTSRNAQELWVESFSSDLKRESKLTKINELKESKNGDNYGQIFVLSNKVGGEKIFVGYEIIPKDGENVRVAYKLLNNELEVSDVSEETLPITVSKKRRENFLTSSYELGDDGKIYVYSNIRLSKEELEEKPKGASSSYSMLTIIDPTHAVSNSISIRSEGKNIFQFGTEVNSSGTILYGFFCDLEQDPKGRETHGIFYGMVDKNSTELKDMKFSYFDKEFLKELFANDLDTKIKEKKEEGKTKSKKKQKQEKAEEDNLGYSYTIEVVRHRSDNGNLMLFCTKERNYTTQNCTTTNGTTRCYTVYHCEKTDVTVFELDKQGKIVGANHIDRFRHYYGWQVKDVSVIEKDGNYLVFYSNTTTDQTTKNQKAKQTKSKDMRTDLFEYAVLNTKAKTFEKKNYRLNKLNTPKPEIKTIEPTNIFILDNEAYVHSFTKGKIKTSGIIITAVACVVCWPAGMLMAMNSPFPKTKTGYLGKITFATE